MCLLLVLAPSTASADHAVWDFKKYNYWINSQSFVDNLAGLSLSHAQVQHWVKYAGSTWPVNTGANVTTTNAGITSSWECDNKDGNNVVSALPGCKDGSTSNCAEWGYARVWRSGIFGTGPYIVESDICISNSTSGGPDNWEVTPDAFGNGEDDLVHVLMHEFGHALGMHHPDEFSPPGPDGVIMGQSLGIGNNRGRVQFGWDLAQLRDLYLPDAGVFFRSGVGFTWLTSHLFDAAEGAWGAGRVYRHQSTSNEPPMDSWSALWDSEFPVGFATAPFSTKAYFLSYPN